jgi:two-component system phosphate regulon response regulator PhoB
MARILIVDDDEIIAALASEVLIGAGHACGWVVNAAEARRTIKWRRPDLVLLDNDMPGISGSTLLRELRGCDQNYDLPVIMFTRMRGKQDEDQARYNGANDYLRKPLDAAQMLWRVDRILESRAHRPGHQPIADALGLSLGPGHRLPPMVTKRL